MQQHPGEQAAGLGGLGGGSGALPPPICQRSWGDAQARGDGCSASHWPQDRARTSAGGGGSSTGEPPTPGGLTPRPRGTDPPTLGTDPPTSGGLSPRPGLAATAPEAAATGAWRGPVPGSPQPEDAKRATEAIPGRAQARWEWGTAGAPATAATPGTGVPGAAVTACLRGCCRAACEQAAPPPPPPLRHPPHRAAAVPAGLPPAAAGPRHSGEGNVTHCTAMGTPATAAESQPEAPAWHGGPWPAATPA